MPGEPPSQLRNDCFALPPGVAWTPVDEALERLRAGLSCVVGQETVPAAKALGRVLARPVTALRDSPPAPNSAVDGYGFAHACLTEDGGDLPLAEGRAAAGVPHIGAVPAGQALRILTGATLPEGVDTVVLEEDVTAHGDRIRFASGLKPGANTRKAGEDLRAGAPVLDRGRTLRAPDLALLASVGIAEVTVQARLRVGVLSTGDELASPGDTTDPARVYDANRPMLLALAEGWACAPIDLGRAPDDRDRLRAMLDDAATRTDVILTSGGASAGDEDHMSALLRGEGTLFSWRIALKPGRPLALGLWRGVPVFGLPGNPVAALVCALIFARPALSVLRGGPWVTPQGFDVPAAFTKLKKPGRSEYLRARLTPDGRAEVFGSEGSGRVSGLSWADGLVALGPEARQIAPGDPVRFLPYGGLLGAP
jgi:molybdopterin molybdotransferase